MATCTPLKRPLTEARNPVKGPLQNDIGTLTEAKQELDKLIACQKDSQVCCIGTTGDPASETHYPKP